jgi:hypothetical protein
MPGLTSHTAAARAAGNIQGATKRNLQAASTAICNWPHSCPPLDCPSTPLMQMLQRHRAAYARSSWPAALCPSCGIGGSAAATTSTQVREDREGDREGEREGEGGGEREGGEGGERGEEGRGSRRGDCGLAGEGLVSDESTTLQQWRSGNSNDWCCGDSCCA